MNNTDVTVKSIDIIILVANESIYVEEALASARTQVCYSRIFLVENNIKNLEYSEKLKNLAKAYEAEYIFFEKRLPIAENWQRALALGSSTWIAFLHDDDIWPANLIEQILTKSTELDIVFGQYKFFHGAIDILGIAENGNIDMCNSREQLLAKMINSYNHASATVVRRSVDLKFPARYKMALDQHGFRQVVAKNHNLRVGWFTSTIPVHIRQHQAQTTKMVYGLGAQENGRCYRDFFDVIRGEQLQVEKFSRWMENYYTDAILARIFSCNLFNKNIIFTAVILSKFNSKARLLKILILSILRGAFQNTIWNYKIVNNRKLYQDS